MYQFNNLTSNVPNVQTFNGNSGALEYTTYTNPYVYKGIAATAPAANGQLYIPTSGGSTINLYKVDNLGQTIRTPVIGDLVTLGTKSDGWVDVPISTVTNLTTYWQIILRGSQRGGAGGAALVIDTTYDFIVKSPILTSNSWQTWTKPNDAMLIHILCIGGAGGGGSGALIASTGTQKVGGGGGGSGAVSSMYVPAFLIPDTLYIQVGLGGLGGTSVTSSPGNFGTIGRASYVALYPNSASVGNLLLSANGGGSGGANGPVNATGGAGGTVLAVGATSPFYLGLGQFTGTVGQAGTGSITNSAPANITISGIVSGGGGAGCYQILNIYYNGASILSPNSLIPYLTTLSGGVANGTTLESNGSNGYAIKKPLMYVGGSGAARASNGSGGRGGDGNIGCGGGGGGVASAISSGAGGNGGDGIVIITSYSI